MVSSTSYLPLSLAIVGGLTNKSSISKLVGRRTLAAYVLPHVATSRWQLYCAPIITNMKKTGLSILLIVFVSFAHAQFKLGVQAGINMASVQQNMAAVTNKSAMGFTAGIETNWKLGKKTALITSLHYAMKGYRYKEAKNDIGDTYKTDGEQKIHYLELPIVFAYEMQLKNYTLSIGAGPALATALSGYYKETNELLGQSFTVKEDLQFGMYNNTQLKGIDWGAHLHVAIAMPKGFFAKLYYTHGLNNLGNGAASTIVQNGQVTYKPQDEYFNRNAGLMLGYYFGKRR